MRKEKVDFKLVYKTVLTLVGVMYLSVSTIGAETLLRGGDAESPATGFRATGLYGSGRLAGSTIFHRKLSLSNPFPKAELEAARQAGCLIMIQLTSPFSLTAKDSDESNLQCLRQWWEKADPSLIDALCFNEEQPYNAPQWLVPLHGEFRKLQQTRTQQQVRLCTWPSFTLGPFEIDSDGFIYDAYGQNYTDFRKWVLQFLQTGKPLYMVVDGSGYSDIKSAREQVMVCREFNLPTLYFTAENGRGGWSGWYSNTSNFHLAAQRNFVFSAMEFQRRDLPAAEFAWGDVVELVPDKKDMLDYSWKGIGKATVFGFQQVSVEKDSLRVSGNATLDFQFWSLFPLQEPIFSLSSFDNTDLPPVQCEISRCGNPTEWRPITGNLQDGKWIFRLGKCNREFRLRLTLNQNSPRLGHFRLTGGFKLPPARQVPLDDFWNGWRGRYLYQEVFADGRWKTNSTINNPEGLEPNQLAIRGHSGGTASTTIIQRFMSPKPLKYVSARLFGQSNSSNLGCSFSLGISFDGKEIIYQGIPSGLRGKTGWFKGYQEISFETDKQNSQVREFFVHMTLSSSSRVATNIGGVLERLEVEASAELPLPVK